MGRAGNYGNDGWWLVGMGPTVGGLYLVEGKHGRAHVVEVHLLVDPLSVGADPVDQEGTHALAHTEHAVVIARPELALEELDAHYRENEEEEEDHHADVDEGRHAGEADVDDDLEARCTLDSTKGPKRTQGAEGAEA